MTHTKFEVARLLGARALQIKMGAPILVKVPKTVERPLDIAKLELEQGVIPITVRVREEKKIRPIKVIPEITLFDEEAVEEEVKGEKETAEESFEEELVVEESE
jgi:DNA-directed RNA polymerase subunit K